MPKDWEWRFPSITPFPPLAVAQGDRRGSADEARRRVGDAMNVVIICEDDSLAGYRGSSLPKGVRIIDIGVSATTPADLLPTVLDKVLVDVVVLGGELADEYILTAAAGLAAAHPEIEVVAYRYPDIDFLAAAMKNRIREVVTPADNHSTLDQALSRLHDAASVRRHVILTQEGYRQPVGTITVFGPKGGVGKSTIAVNLAYALASQAANEVLLIDLDLVGGDVADLLQIEKDLTVAQAINNDDTFDPVDPRLSLAALPSGPLVLPAPASLAEAAHLDADSMELLLKRMVDTFSHVVVDTGPGTTEASLAAISAARQLILVTRPDVSAVRTLVRHMEALESLGLLPPNRLLVLNQYDRRCGVGTADIETALGRPIDFVLPPDRTVQALANEGVPYMRNRSRGVVAATFHELAAAVQGTSEHKTQEPVRSRGWFR